MNTRAVLALLVVTLVPSAVWACGQALLVDAYPHWEVICVQLSLALVVGIPIWRMLLADISRSMSQSVVLRTIAAYVGGIVATTLGFFAAEYFFVKESDFGLFYDVEPFEWGYLICGAIGFGVSVGVAIYLRRKRATLPVAISVSVWIVALSLLFAFAIRPSVDVLRSPKINTQITF